MTAAGCFLLALAVADLVAGGLSGSPRSPKSAGLGAAVGVAVLWASAFALGAAPVPALSLALGSVALAGWLGLRATPRLEATPWPLVWLAVSVLGLVVAFPGQLALRPGAVRAVLGSPWPGIAGAEPEVIVFLAGAFGALATTANGVVRAVLALAGSNVSAAETTLLGGRIIGVLERWLILGFVLAGEGTAAALVVPAKSLVRFPELTAAREQGGNGGAGATPGAPRRVDVVTEYFLLGSLTSWLLAVLPATLLR